VFEVLVMSYSRAG